VEPLIAHISSSSEVLCVTLSDNQKNPLLTKVVDEHYASMAVLGVPRDHTVVGQFETRRFPHARQEILEYLIKLKQDFLSAAKSLRTSNSHLTVIAVNGCCYGRDNKPDKGGYQKYCGQKFWEFISGNENLYLEIIEPLGYNAKSKNDE